MATKNDPKHVAHDDERTATDEMADRYRNGAHVVPANRDPADSEQTGLPRGMHDDHRSPVAPK